MKYKNTSRKGALLYLLNLITLGFFFLFFMIRIRREIESLGRKKGIPYPAVFILGIFTLWIVPLIWFSNRAEEIGLAHREQKLEGKSIDFSFMFCWLAFGCFIIVGPFIAFHRFFSVLNRLEAANNIIMTTAAKTRDDVHPEEKEPELPVDDSALTQRVPYVRFDPKYADATGNYWCIKLDGKYYYFEKQFEAIAFAKRVAEDRGVNITVLGKREGEKPERHSGKKLMIVSESEKRAAIKARRLAEEEAKAKAEIKVVGLKVEEPANPAA